MGLTTESPIDTDAVEAICCLPDDLYRLRWVSYAYYDLSTRLSAKVGENNATWPAFARWSAYTISESLRVDRVNPRLKEVLRQHALPDGVAGPLVEIQKRMRSLDDGAMPTVLALGNRMVFHEVGWTIAHFLEFLERQDDRNPEPWAAYEGCIQPFEATDFFRSGYPEWLRDGVHAYYDACWENDPAKKAQLVLRGNILIGAYEQWRVNSFFDVALDFNPGSLIRELRVRHDEIGTRPVGVRHGGTRRALRHQWALLDWLADAYAAFLTRFVLTWDAALDSEKPTALRLGCDLPSRRQAALTENTLETLDDDVQRLFDTFDRSGGELRGSGARNWRRFTDRMSFIVNLFRSQQQNPNLRVAPFFKEKRLLELRLNDEDLQALRKIGDPRDEELVARMDLGEVDAEHLARDFVQRKAPYDIMRERQLQIAYPDWVDPAKIAQGREFFKEHSMEIAAALFAGSLPKAYTAAKGARVLVTTAELVSDVSRRIAETGRLLLDVMLPDDAGLEPGSRGYTTVLAVRGFHSAIRKMLAEHEPWKTEWDETPINQEDLLGTLTTFTVIVIESLEKMDIVVSDADRDAYLHTWLVVGHLLGIDYDLLRRHPFNQDLEPLTYFEMQLVRDSIFRRQAAPSASGEILTRALLAVQESALPRALRPLPPAAIRRFIGYDAADLLGVPPAGPVRVLLGALGPVGSAVDWIAQGRLLRPRLADMSTQMFRQWVAEQPGALREWAIDGLDSELRLNPVIDLRDPKPDPPLWNEESARLQSPA